MTRSGAGSAAGLFIGKSGSFFKDLEEHAPGQFARLGVLVRGMVRGQQRAPVRHTILGPMLKDISGFIS